MTQALKDDELTAYSSEHLMHELSMLWELAEMLPGRAPGTETSALLESFAIHLRNLIEFFYYPKKGEYVRAQDFFEDPGKWSPKLMSDTEKLLDRANNEVSHLTVRRISGSPPEKQWNTTHMLKQIESIAKEFAAKACDKKLDPRVREFLGLPGIEMRIWIGKNVTHSNVTSHDVSVTAFPVANCSTHTGIISKLDLKQP
jgi:hypothetical protein